MAIAFPRTARALDLDRGIENWALGGVGSAILVGWWIWAMIAALPLTLDASEARVEPRGGQLPLVWNEPARLAELRIASGEHVTKGQVIAGRDDRDLRRERDLATVRLQQAVEEAERLDSELKALASADERGARADEAKVDAAELSAAKSRLSLETAVNAAERSRALSGKGLITRSADEQAQAEADLARNVNAAAVSELLRAKLDVQVAATQRQIEALTRERRRNEAEIAVQAARLTLAGAESALRDAYIASPADGTIVVPNGIAPGAFVAAGETVATLYRDGAIEVRARFEEADAVARLKPGQSAVMTQERTGGLAPVDLRVLSVVASTDGPGAEVILVAVDSAKLLPIGLGGRVSVETGTATPLALVASVLGFESGGAK